MSEISSVVTAVCAVLGVIGGFVVWMNNIIQSRMPACHFTVFRVLSSRIYRVTLYPKRIKHVYLLENIQSSYPLYAQFKGVDILGRGDVQLIDELNKENLGIVIQSCYQQLEKEPIIEFFIDLKGYQKPIYSMRLLFKSEHFPFRWGKPVNIAIDTKEAT
ncbi:hypothetical protein E4T80_09720 [Muribacter muris]|uniref:Uncharacterized protein n=1 Tax=Muribacter muris TaxID=67855 RepID=A0A4Y9JSL0_9PAST|nr:hypothetical protein [Muribacter muris]MBF0785735.1 hypothetical protein [Muribacter muris]MBF0828293.1 hypothetical protein [Muribacter muris]TFV08558.1 hypothetical protein E4T80_09720 [Muribacter muris]